jgi:membrane protein DedA with SNARE-associated domain
MEHLTHVLTDIVMKFGYEGLFIVVVLGNVGFPAALEVMIPFAGGLAAQGHLPPFFGLPGWVGVALVSVLGELVGSAILYSIGWYGGRPFVHRYGKYVRVTDHELDRVHGYYDKYGPVTAFVARFVPFVRGLAALPAGIARMSPYGFFTFSTLGSIVFCFGLAYLGHVAGRNLDALLGSLHKASLLIVIIIVLLVIAAIVIAVVMRRKKNAPVG